MGYINFMIIMEIIIAINSFLLGLFCIYKPEAAIKMEQEFYRWLNWEVRPISKTKEVRNTVVIGILLFCLSIVIGYYAICGLRC